MTTYDELEAFASAGLFHNDPTEAHSASSQTDVDCALATAAHNVRTTTAGTIVRRKTETKVFRAFPLFDRTDFVWPHGAKIVRCALDQSSKVGDLIRCANYICMLWVIKHRAQGYTVQNSARWRKDCSLRSGSKFKSQRFNSMCELYI